MIALGADHGGFELKGAIKGHLTAQKIAFIDFGTHSAAATKIARIKAEEEAFHV